MCTENKSGNRASQERMAKFDYVEEAYLSYLEQFMQQNPRVEDLIDTLRIRGEFIRASGTNYYPESEGDWELKQARIRRPIYELDMDDLPAFIDELIGYGFRLPGATITLALAITAKVLSSSGGFSRSSKYGSERKKLYEAIEESFSDNHTVKLVMECCKKSIY